MKKFLLISVLLGTLVFGQKNNHSTQASPTVQQISTETSSVSATVPRRLSYQGLLTKANGRAVKDGSYPVTFRLWTELEGGTKFWEEEQTLDIDDGIISAILGATSPIETIPADAYLEIDINGTTLSPRQEMTSVFYSVISDTAKFSQGGRYTDLDNLPDLTVYAPKDTLANYVLTNSLDSVAFTGDYNDLENIPDLSTVSVTGDYNDLDNLPDLSGLTQSDTLNFYVMSDSLSQYTLTANLAAVALSNDYNDLNNLPDLDQYATLDTLGTYVFSDTLANYVLTDSLGTLAEQNADNVDITGGTITDITDLAIADGGTGASDNSSARANLGVEIGVDVQAYDADLADLADGTLSADKVEYLENVTSDVQAQLDAKASLGELGSIAIQDADNVSITGGSITDITDIAIADGGTGASDVASARSNLGLEIGVDVQGYDADLADLADGKLSASKVENGEYFISTDGTNGQVWTSDGDGAGVWGDLTGITGAASTIDTEDLTASRAVVSNSDGKIAVSDVTSTELGYMAGVTSNVQTQLDSKQNKDDHLSDIADLSHSDGNFIVSDGSKWTIENGADARTSLGMGSIATQEADNVSITGGSITGITDLAIADGGTNASDVATARSNLGLEIGVDIQAYDADLADLADGELSASKVQYGITSEGTSGQVWTSDGDGPGDWSTASSVTVNITDNESTDEGNALIFAADADLDGGTLGLESDGDATYNPSTGVITATGFTTGSTGLILENAETITNATDGTVLINGIVKGGTGSAAGVFSSNGDYNVILQTGNSTTGTITITDGSNGNIAITPNGSGEVDISKVDIDGGAIDGTAIGAASATTGAFTTITASTSLDVTGSAGIILENDETITNATNGTVLITAPTTAVSGDLTLVDDESIILGNHSDIKITYDEATNDALEIAANVDGTGLELVLKADQGDDAGDEWSVNVADGGVMTFGNDIASAGTYVTHLTVTPHATIASSSVAIAGDATVGDDLTITGNDITFGNAETISNSSDGTVAITATTTTISGDLTVTGNDITFGNGESISNATDGTVLINGIVKGGTGSAAGVFTSNGDYDVTLQTGNSTTGTITITDGSNGNIAITPNGSGEVDISKVDIASGAIDGTAIGAASATTGAFTTIAGTSITASTKVDITGSAGLVLQNDETITNATDGTVLITAPTTAVSADLTLVDDESVILGTNSDIKITYDEATNDALEIAANVEGTGLELVLKADQGDDAGDEWSINVADGGVMTFGNDKASAGTYVTHLTITPHATIASSSVAIAGDATVGDDLTITVASPAIATEELAIVACGVTVRWVT